LAVSPEAPLFQVGTHLATGCSIYVDGLIVARDNRLVGRISGKHILGHVLNMRNDDWSSVTALELMDGNTSSVEIDSSLSSLLELFARTKFALAPITDKKS
jgi:predicted transcriptional regulator